MDDPYLIRNLSRLEARFKARYDASVQRDEERKGKGKQSHKTTLRSIQQNKERWEKIQEIRAVLFPKC